MTPHGGDELTKRAFLVVLTLLAAIGVGRAGELVPFAEPMAPDIPGLTAHAMNQAVGRAANLGGTLDAPSEGAWGITLSERMFEAASEAGFDTIRLPVRFSNHAEAAPPYRLDEAFMRRVDFAIDNALANDMKIIVDFHSYRQLEGDEPVPGETEVELGDEELRDRFLGIWEQIARRYQSLPNDKVLFELYNEPHGKLTPQIYIRLVADALDLVRRTNPYRFVVVGATDWGTAWGLEDLALPKTDRRLLVSVHNYAPFQFTMQGADWIEGSMAWLGTGCCSEAQLEEIRVPLRIAAEWSDANDRPIFVGEFGSNAQAAYADRVTFTRIMRAEIESRNFSWGYWDFASVEFGPWDPATDSWRVELREALTGP